MLLGSTGVWKHALPYQESADCCHGPLALASAGPRGPPSSAGRSFNFNFFAPGRLIFGLPSQAQSLQRDLCLPHPPVILDDISCILDVRSPAPWSVSVCFVVLEAEGELGLL